MKPIRNPSTITRWTVQEFHDGMWQTWSGMNGPEWRFWSFHNARKAYEENKKEFHYCPCTYRYCKVEIQPEYIVDIEYFKTVELTVEDYT